MNNNTLNVLDVLNVLNVRVLLYNLLRWSANGNDDGHHHNDVLIITISVPIIQFN